MAFWWEPVPVAPSAEHSNWILVLEPTASSQGIVYVTPAAHSQIAVAVVPVVEKARDSAYIMVQSITQDYFQNNIQKFLPYEYWRLDGKTYDEGGGEGDLATYMEVFAISLDEVKQAIDDFTKIFDIDHCPSRYLRVIAELLSFPLEDTDSTSAQRGQLKDAIHWYKTKGSRKAFTAILYAFGFYADMIPLWTEDYATFTETIPGVAAGNDPPNDYPLLVENGGTWYRSPHYGIRLLGIVEDRHVFIEWGSLTENQIPIPNEFLADPDGVDTDFGGLLRYAPLIPATFEGTTWALGAEVTFSDDGAGNITGVGVSGTIDYTTGQWALTFGTAPTGVINASYEYDFEDLIDQMGYHKAFYRMIDELSAAGAWLRLHFDTADFNYIFRRIEFLRPVFAVLDWLELQFGMQEEYVVPESAEPIMSANPVRDDKGWYLGYCDLDDITYTRLDQRLLGPDMLTLTSPLGAGAPTVVSVVNEIIEAVSSVLTSASGTLANSWIYTGVEITITVAAVPYTVLDNGEGVLVGEDEDIYGLIDYLTGDWVLYFDGTAPDNPSNIVIDYDYTVEVPPCDRSGAAPRGSTALPFPHLRNPQEGYCHPPEDLDIDWYWINEEPYTLSLTRDGMKIYPPAGPVLYIDHADFPSRGFTKAGSVADHANTMTRQYGYSTRPLSLLKVEENPAADAENWENQGTDWDSWSGTPWESIGD